MTVTIRCKHMTTSKLPYEVLNLIFTLDANIHLQSSAVNKVFRRLWQERLARSLVLPPSRYTLYHKTWPSMTEYNLSVIDTTDAIWSYNTQGLGQQLTCDSVRCSYSTVSEEFKLTILSTKKTILIPSIADCMLFNYDPRLFSQKVHLWNIWKRLNMSPGLFEIYLSCQDKTYSMSKIIEGYKEWRLYNIDIS